MQPEEVDYINAHATGTLLEDRAEMTCIKRVFGKHAYDLKVSATKSATGHLFGAAGRLESVITVKSLREGIIPPTINIDEQDSECDLDIVPNRAVTSPIRVAMSNGFGFGGHNAVLLFKGNL